MKLSTVVMAQVAPLNVPLCFHTFMPGGGGSVCSESGLFGWQGFLKGRLTRRKAKNEKRREKNIVKLISAARRPPPCQEMGLFPHFHSVLFSSSVIYFLHMEVFIIE